MQTKIRLVMATVLAAVIAALVGWIAMEQEAPPESAQAPAPVSAQARSSVVAEPLPARPSQALAQLVEAAAHGQPTPFLQDLTGRLPKGQVQVAQADQVDAGAEEGHAVPVTVWVNGDPAVAALTGTARFERSGPGYRVQELTLRSLPLKIGSWAQARAAVPGLTGGARPADAPFFGRFRFVEGNRHVAVDAVSGAVEPE